MKDEAHISELLAETFHRIDRHSEHIELPSTGTELQLTASSLLINQSQKNKECLSQPSEAISAPGERTAATRQPSLEQQKAY